MGGQGSGRLPGIDTIVKRNTNQPYNPVGALLPSEQIIIPNQSGDHSAGHTKTPLYDNSLVNKKYVDDAITANSPVYAYGEMFGDSTPIPILSTGDWVEIQGDFHSNNTGNLLNVTFPNVWYLKVQKAGKYLCNWHMSIRTDQGNAEVLGGIFINGVSYSDYDGTANINYIGDSAQIFNFGASAILDLDVDDEVSLGILSNERVLIYRSSMTLNLIQAT